MSPRLLTTLVLLLLLTAGCAGQVAEMPTWVGFDEYDDDAVLVLKVVPSASVLLAAGRIDAQGFRPKGPKSQMWLAAEDGYIVARVSATADDGAYAVVQVRAEQIADGAAPTYETGFWSPVAADAATGASGQAFGPSGEARLPVLSATAARVSFAGTLRLDAIRQPGSTEAVQKLAVTPATSADDLAAVTRFLAQHYPKVTARVVPVPLRMLRRHEGG